MHKWGEEQREREKQTQDPDDDLSRSQVLNRQLPRSPINLLLG